MKKYNIAQIGTFDLENYGDLLFPDVLEKNLRQRLDLDNLVLFSPLGGKKPFETDVTVYKISDFDELQKKYNFDAIIVGGGDLLRLDNSVANKNNYGANDPSFDLFVLPSVYAQKYNIPLYYNVPGAPFPFNNTFSYLIKSIYNSVSYFSVRDSKSADYFRNAIKDNNAEICVSPDSVFDITNLYDRKKTDNCFKKLAEKYSLTENRYIIFQSASTIVGENEPVYAQELDKIANETGCEIVFMPITYVHNDTDAMKSVFDKTETANKKFVDDRLSPFEMTSLLAKSAGYLGSSLHGGIVSTAYKKPVCEINLLCLSKIDGVFADLGLSKNIVKNAHEISETFLKAEAPSDGIIANTQKKIADHFDTVCDKIKSVKKNDFCMIADTISDYVQVCKERSVKVTPPLCTAYYDSGDGLFSEEAKNISDFKYSFSFSVPQGTKQVRLDFGEGFCCIIGDLKIENEFGKCRFSPINGYLFDSSVIFNTTDPQLLVKLNHDNVKSLKVSFEYIPFGNDIYSEFIFSLIGRGNETKNELNAALGEAVKEKDNLLKEKSELSDKVKKLSYENSRLSSQLNSSNSIISELTQSTSWKITKPLRKISSLRLLIIKGFYYYKLHGMKATIHRILHRNAPPPREIQDKLAEIAAAYYITDETRKEQEQTKFSRNIKFSVLVPLYNTPENFLREMIESVQAQTYKNWELCLADGSDNEHEYVKKTVLEYSKKDDRIIYKKLEKNLGISENTNACIEMASGEYIALFDHDDLLHPSALFEVMKAICEQNADYIYTDENTFSETPDDAYNPHFKPDFSPDTLRSYNYICHLSVFSRALLDSVGYFNSEYDGSQDYELILRLTEKAENIVHIPKILYYWRAHKASVAQSIGAKPYTVTSAKKALSAHLERVGLEGEVLDTKYATFYHIKYAIKDNPLISILIPNKDHIDDLDKCITSLFDKLTYRNFEIVIVENNSTQEETFNYYEKLKEQHSNVNVVFWEREFNYSAINNYGAQFCNGEYILLLNNDVEIITPEALEEMLMFCQRDDVGAVGAKLYYPDDTIQHAGVILGIGGVAGHSHKYISKEEHGYFARAVVAQNLSACTAACLMVKKSVFKEIEGFDESFAVAFNDVDLCMKIRKLGYLIVFTPFAQLYHYESKSRGVEDTPEKVARFNGETNRFFAKWQAELDKGDPYYNPNLTLDREDFSFK